MFKTTLNTYEPTPLQKKALIHTANFNSRTHDNNLDILKRDLETFAIYDAYAGEFIKENRELKTISIVHNGNETKILTIREINLL